MFGTVEEHHGPIPARERPGVDLLGPLKGGGWRVDGLTTTVCTGIPSITQVQIQGLDGQASIPPFPLQFLAALPGPPPLPASR